MIALVASIVELTTCNVTKHARYVRDLLVNERCSFPPL